MVVCRVMIDGSLTEIDLTFLTVPRIGETIIARVDGEIEAFYVKEIVNFASDATDELQPFAQLSVSRKK